VIPTQRVRAGVYLVDLLLRQRNTERAVIVAKDVVSRAPKDFSALRALGRAEIAAGNNRGARQTLSVMGPLVGFDPDMNVELARLHLAAGDREGAAYSLEKALKNNADYLPALVLHAEMEIVSGDYAKAEQRARQIVERYPAKGAGLRLLGDIAAARGQPNVAITSYRAALAKEKLTDTALRLNRAYVQAGDAAKGLLFLEQWCRENPDDSAAFRVLADGRLRAGDLAAARAGYERLLQRYPDDAEVLNNLAQVAIRQGDKTAVGYAERAHKLAKDNAAILDTLGWALVRNGSLDRGIGLLRDARLRDTSSPDIRYHLAAGLAQAGRDAEARSELKEILKEGVVFDELEEARRLQRTLGP
jgi:putative PEP-CTERM system TPR-repeat lipoprotein